jgi:hypothetical protein
VDRYGRDVLGSNPHARPAAPEIPARPGLVVECAETGYCGAVIRVEKTAEGRAVLLEDRHGRQRWFPLRAAAFLHEGVPVTLAPPAVTQRPKRSASGSRYVDGQRAQVARASRIWVEGVHDAELVEKVWGHDLRVAGVVVEPLHGADVLLEALREFGPAPRRRVGVLLDHLVPGSKESRLAAEVTTPHVLVLGHPYVDVWQAVKPQVLGIPAWPRVPPGRPWKAGVIEALGWRLDEGEAWRHILSRVRGYGDLEPALLGRVEELIDFVTTEGLRDS